MSTRYILEPRSPGSGVEPTPEIVEIAKRVAENFAAREAGLARDEWNRDDVELWGRGFFLKPVGGGGLA